MDATAIPKPIPTCCTILNKVEPAPLCSCDRSPTVSVLIELKIIDMQAPYHIKLHIIHVVDDEVSSHDMETVEPAIKSDDKINVVL